MPNFPRLVAASLHRNQYRRAADVAEMWEATAAAYPTARNLSAAAACRAIADEHWRAMRAAEAEAEAEATDDCRVTAPAATLAF